MYVYPQIGGNFPSIVGVPNFWETGEERAEAFFKGVVMLVVISLLTVILMISIVRVVKTPPGGIPEEKEWDMQSDSQAESSSEDEAAADKHKKQKGAPPNSKDAGE